MALDTANGQQASPSRSLDLPSLQPLSHDHPLLAATDFDPDAFLLSRIHIPLEELRGELREYLALLREELVQLINDDYEEFISLGIGLRGEGERLARLDKPLADLCSRIEDVRGTLVRHQKSIESKLEARAILREERALLTLVNRLLDAVARTEAMWASREDGDCAKLVGRIAGEYTQLLYLLHKAEAEQCKVVMDVEKRIARIKSSLSGELATLLISSVAEGSIAGVRQSLETYELIEGWREAEEEIRRGFRAMCRQTISVESVPQTPHRDSPFEPLERLFEGSPLAVMFNRVLEQIEPYRMLMTLADEMSDQFDFFGGVLWPEIASAIVDNIGSFIFAAGRPDELHEGDAYQTFERRWQLPVYFQLRWKEITSRFASELGGDATDGWQLPLSGAAWQALESCWAKDIYLAELSSRFWRLSLQIVNRYSRLLEAGVEGDEDQEESALRYASAAILDLNRFAARSEKLEIASELAAHLCVSTALYQERLVAILSRRCSDGLKLVRSVASQYRALTPASKVEPSYFIPTILGPLHQFFEAHSGLRREYGIAWSTQVADQVLRGYASILASVRKTEDLLRRHRKSKKTTFSLFGNKEVDGEDERFRQQMLADADALAKDASGMGVDVRALGGWTELQDVINRPAE